RRARSLRGHARHRIEQTSTEKRARVSPPGHAKWKRSFCDADDVTAGWDQVARQSDGERALVDAAGCRSSPDDGALGINDGECRRRLHVGREVENEGELVRAGGHVDRCDGRRGAADRLRIDVDDGDGELWEGWAGGTDLR